MLARLGLPEVTVSSALQAAVIACAYFVADAVLNKIALGDGWQIFWPLNGVTIALLISRPRREWAAGARCGKRSVRASANILTTTP